MTYDFIDSGMLMSFF